MTQSTRIHTLLKVSKYYLNLIRTLEHCAGEAFEPRCEKGHVILMHSALYGRMEIGRCLPTDTGYMGCKSNVLPHFDKECSGKQTCETVVFDRFINAQGGCIKGLQSYLEVEYECVKGSNVFYEHLFLDQTYLTKHLYY